MLLPAGVTIDGLTGAVSPDTGRYVKRLSELRGIFADAGAVDRMVAGEGDPKVYEVVEFKKPGSDLFFGTTTMEPGQVGAEYFMTRGHFHERRDMGEVYYTQSGSGLLVLESREGRVETVAMAPGTCAFIPPDWAHRSVNTGTGKLVFVWVCQVEAGHDYADILSRGMRKRVMCRGGEPELVDNAAYAA